MVARSMRSKRAKRSKRSAKRGGSRKLSKLVPWGLVLANQLFSKRRTGRSTRRRRSSRRTRRRR